MIFLNNLLRFFRGFVFILLKIKVIFDFLIFFFLLIIMLYLLKIILKDYFDLLFVLSFLVI